MLKRLILREYLPLAGSLAFWLLVVLASGPEGLAVTLAAMLAASAAHAAAFANLRKSAVLQLAADGDVLALWKRALPYEAASLALEASVVAAILILLFHVGYAYAVVPVLLASLGLPARHRGVLTAIAQHRGRNTDGTKTVRSAVSGVIAVAAFSLGAPVWVYAAILALREWLALLAVIAIVARPAVPVLGAAPKEGSFDLSGIAMATRRLGTKRLAYRALKPLFSVLGPVGAGALRTARGTGFLDREWVQLSRVHWVSTIAAILSLGGTATAFAFGPTAPHLVIGCALLNFACISGNLAAWSWIVRSLPEPEEDGEPEEGED